MKVYLSGPMTGYPDLNFPAFQASARLLREQGHEVIDPSETTVEGEETWSKYLRADLKLLVDCEAVATLPGWDNSRGARLEVHVANELRMQVFAAPVAPGSHLE